MQLHRDCSELSPGIQLQLGRENLRRREGESGRESESWRAVKTAFECIGEFQLRDFHDRKIYVGIRRLLLDCVDCVGSILGQYYCGYSILIKVKARIVCEILYIKFNMRNER